MKVINLIGGPNTGKSTTAFGLMFEMKKLGLSVEYAGEYAKEMVYERRNNILQDQLYILAKQNRRLHRLRGEVDYVVTDSSLLLGLVYANAEQHEILAPVVYSFFHSYDNRVFLFPRNRNIPFDPKGRVQKSHDESEAFDVKVGAIVPPGSFTLPAGEDYARLILSSILGELPAVGSA